MIEFVKDSCYRIKYLTCFTLLSTVICFRWKVKVNWTMLSIIPLQHTLPPTHTDTQTHTNNNSKLANDVPSSVNILYWDKWQESVIELVERYAGRLLYSRFRKHFIYFLYLLLFVLIVLIVLLILIVLMVSWLCSLFAI